MSGICGLFDLGDAPVARAELRAMTAMLERRGPDSSNVWHDGHVGLGNTLLSTTPEHLIESQPLKDAQTGCAITVDARLDNRNELLRSLEIEERGDALGDAELILRAYLSWDEDCLDRLLGDFAFAIWDPRHKKLFCVRDHFGTRPLNYHYSPGRRFVFASDPRAILVLPQVPYRVSEERIADFLVPQLERIDFTSTFYENIYRLPPGHKMTASMKGMEVTEYWKPVPGAELPPLSDEEYAEGFLEVFTESVAARLRAPPGTVCSMLSGGIDSGSVTAVAREILASRGRPPLPTYSAVQSDVTDCVETRSIQAAIAMPSIAPNLIELEAVSDTIKPIIAKNEEPYDAEMTMIQCIYRAARENGHRVVLDGMSGDVVLAEGSYIVRLIRSGRIGTAMKEVVAENRFWGDERYVRRLIRYGRAALLPEGIRKKLTEFRRDSRVEKAVCASLISASLADRVNIAGRIKRMQQNLAREWRADYAVERCEIIRPSVTAGRERYSRAAAAFGAEARDPFLDKRVVDYCLSLPGRLLLRNGWPKFILRDAMACKLPDEVRWQRGKPHLGWRFNRAVTRNAIDRGEINLERLQKELQDYVDPQALRNAWQNISSGGDGEHAHSAHVLTVWLQENAVRPRIED